MISFTATSRDQHGFTLLEMVIAIGIFAVMSAVAYGSLNGFLDNRDRIEAKHKALGEIQLALAFIERDVRFAVPRPVRDDNGEPEGAFVVSATSPIVAGEKLRMTTSVPRPPMPEKKSEDDDSDGSETSLKKVDDVRSDQSLVRVAYRLEGTDLYRIVWNVLDRDADSIEKKRRVIGGVEEFKVTALSINTETQKVDTTGTWPDSDEAFTRSANPDKPSLGGATLDGAPDGLEVVMSLENGRTFTRVLEIAAPPIAWEPPDFVAPDNANTGPTGNRPNRPRPESQDPDEDNGNINDDINDPNSPDFQDAERDPDLNDDDRPPPPGAPDPDVSDQGIYDPTNPSSPNYDPALDPNSPMYTDPDYQGDPSDPNSPNYDPALDPNSPQYTDPNYDPTQDPDNPAYEGVPEDPPGVDVEPPEEEIDREELDPDEFDPDQPEDVGGEQG